MFPSFHKNWKNNISLFLFPKIWMRVSFVSFWTESVLKVFIDLFLAIASIECWRKYLALCLQAANFVICCWSLQTVWNRILSLTECRAWSGSKWFDTLKVILKEFFENVDMKNASRWQNNHEKLRSMQRDNLCSFFCCSYSSLMSVSACVICW